MHYLGLVDRTPALAPCEPTKAQEVVGVYGIDAMRLVIDTDGESLSLTVGIETEIRAASDRRRPAGLPTGRDRPAAPRTSTSSPRVARPDNGATSPATSTATSRASISPVGSSTGSGVVLTRRPGGDRPVHGRSPAPTPLRGCPQPDRPRPSRTARSSGEYAPSARSRSNGAAATSGGCAMNLGRVPWLGWAAWIRNGWQR